MASFNFGANVKPKAPKKPKGSPRAPLSPAQKATAQFYIGRAGKHR